MNQVKDPIIKFKSVKRSQAKNGDDGIALYLDQEQTQLLVSELSNLQSNERGVKVQLYVGERETKDGSRIYTTGYAFLKAIQEFGSSVVGTKKKVVPVKGATISAATRAKVEQTKAELA